MKLNELRDNPGATRPRKRVGRGIGSGLGKTCGRGHKGQGSRSGVSVQGFEGGQMPLFKRLPKRGFRQPNRRRYAEVNLCKLQVAIDTGRLDASKEINADVLLATGLVRRVYSGIRLLAKGELQAKIVIVVRHASRAAVDAVSKAGGQVVTIPSKKDALNELSAAAAKSE